MITVLAAFIFIFFFLFIEIYFFLIRFHSFHIVCSLVHIGTDDATSFTVLWLLLLWNDLICNYKYHVHVCSAVSTGTLTCIRLKRIRCNFERFVWFDEAHIDICWLFIYFEFSNHSVTKSSHFARMCSKEEEKQFQLRMSERIRGTFNWSHGSRKKDYESSWWSCSTWVMMWFLSMKQKHEIH